MEGIFLLILMIIALGTVQFDGHVWLIFTIVAFLINFGHLVRLITGKENWTVGAHFLFDGILLFFCFVALTMSKPTVGEIIDSGLMSIKYAPPVHWFLFSLASLVFAIIDLGRTFRKTGDVMTQALKVRFTLYIFAIIGFFSIYLYTLEIWSERPY